MQTRRFATMLWGALSLALCLGLCRHSQAVEYSVQRRDYRFNTYFEVGADGAPVGTVLRERWRQPMRAHYVLYSSDGSVQAQGTTRLWSPGLIFSWAQTVDIADAQGKSLYTLSGDFLTTEAARFRLKTPAGETVALLYVDLATTGCVATHPDNSFTILTRYYRNQVSDYTHERWDFTTVPEGPVAPAIWQLIGAFLADTW
ncbi:MAG: hypothetical protein EOO40_07325 [Deltaproteobacteria bacterium]|nr:MAG: hypothetical protein EOO40_07325 [Deltaproteobacteria bacterium]